MYVYSQRSVKFLIFIFGILIITLWFSKSRKGEMEGAMLPARRVWVFEDNRQAHFVPAGELRFFALFHDVAVVPYGATVIIVDSADRDPSRTVLPLEFAPGDRGGKIIHLDALAVREAVKDEKFLIVRRCATAVVAKIQKIFARPMRGYHVRLR